MLKTSCISSSETSAELLDQAEHRRHGERVVDLIPDLGLEAQQVVEAVAGDVGKPADVDRRAKQLEDRPHVDLGRLEQDVAERAAEALVVQRDVVQRPASQRVAVRVQPGGR